MSKTNIEKFHFVNRMSADRPTEMCVKPGALFFLDCLSSGRESRSKHLYKTVKRLGLSIGRGGRGGIVGGKKSLSFFR